MGKIYVKVIKASVYSDEWRIMLLNPGLTLIDSAGWIEKGVFGDDLAEELGMRWNQGVYRKEETSEDVMLFEVEPVPVTVYGVDGEEHAQRVGRMIL